MTMQNLVGPNQVMFGKLNTMNIYSSEKLDKLNWYLGVTITSVVGNLVI